MSRNDLVVTSRGLRFRGRYFPCSVGRGGCHTGKVEGDGVTPVGRHRIVGCLYRPDRMVPPVEWARAVRIGDMWSDDPSDPAYNHLVRGRHLYSHERLRRADPLYDLVLLTGWNWPDAIAGKGSAIFIHGWRKPGHPTEGCIGLRSKDLDWIVRRVSLGTMLVVPAIPAQSA
ncbi:MAG: L,D-transpeptidase family protein [Paracoccaceae bacterium]